MFTFYQSPGSSSMAAHIALHEVGAEFESRWLSFASKEHRGAAFREVNPEGKVPALLVDGRLLTEVAAILFYLARRYPAAKLIPDDVEGQAQAVSWMSFIAATIHPARQVGPERVRQVFEIAETRLGGRDWALGDYSIADIHLFRLFWRACGAAGPAALPFPGLGAHYHRIMARPAVKKTIEIESKVGYELPA
ncbi:MAG: glutathione S-transferase family protein [Alphaproteobacteria bacterium]